MLAKSHELNDNEEAATEVKQSMKRLETELEEIEKQEQNLKHKDKVNKFISFQQGCLPTF